MAERPEQASWRPTGTPVLFKEDPYPGGALSRLYPDKRAMRALNDVADMFIVGSDQIWHHNLYRAFGEVGCLDFIFNDKKKIAFASSFGRDRWDGDEAVTQEVGTYLRDFDYISVRERSGVDICREVFGVEAQNVLDPVFMCGLSVYTELADKSEMDVPDRYIGAYILDVDEKKKSFLDRVQDVSGLPLHLITDAFDESVFDKSADVARPFVGASCEDWLKNIIRSDLVVTDSFHGMCFAILFKKPFIAIANQKRGAVRFTDLLGRLGLKDRLIYEEDLPGGLDEGKCGPIAYETVYQVLEEARAETLAWFRHALETPKKANVTRYDLLFRQLVEGERRLDGKLQDECGARRWDISIHQSKLNEAFELIRELREQAAAGRAEAEARFRELDEQAAAGRADIEAHLHGLDEQAGARQWDIGVHRAELNEHLQDLQTLHGLAERQKEEIEQLQERCLSVQEQVDRLESSWLMRLGRKASAVKHRLFK